jgi:hypothetical protein
MATTSIDDTTPIRVRQIAPMANRRRDLVVILSTTVAQALSINDSTDFEFITVTNSDDSADIIWISSDGGGPTAGTDRRLPVGQTITYNRCALNDIWVQAKTATCNVWVTAECAPEISGGE